ncbi:MAG: hypothetical protein A4E30_00640 [Methanomassiliicoccales archaeon PtaB.Bin215]|nr:MAG: hypothetical protein A4E30_00640 [Methanomassiliicoccales archaeon PtaB.Bin215]
MRGRLMVTFCMAEYLIFHGVLASLRSLSSNLKVRRQHSEILAVPPRSKTKYVLPFSVAVWQILCRNSW